MIIAHLYGGLGNQLFQYACGKSLAERLGVELKLDISHLLEHVDDSGFTVRNFELNVFNLDDKIASLDEVRKYVPNLYKTSRWHHQLYRAKRLLTGRHWFIERSWNRHQFITSFEKLKDNTYLYGYFQTEKYFNEYRSLIQDKLALKQTVEISKGNELLINEMSNSESVSIHVRRGDYENSIFNLLDVDNYYRKAICRMMEQVENPKFYVFSNDFEWVKNNLPAFGRDMTFVDINSGERSFMDMFLMSRCKHNIIANSSFSWWGAWLNTNKFKRIIAPLEWYKNGKSTRDLIPEDWVTL